MLYVHRRGPTRVVTNERALHAALSAAIPHMQRVVLDGMPLHEQMRTVASATSLVAVFGQALTWMILLERGGGEGSTAGSAHSHGKESGGDERGISGSERAGGAVLELSPKEAFWKQDYQILAKVTAICCLPPLPGLHLSRSLASLSRSLASLSRSLASHSRSHSLTASHATPRTKVLGLRFTRIYGKVAESECVKQPPLRVRWQQRLAAYNRWLTCNLTMDVPAVVQAAREMEAVQIF